MPCFFANASALSLLRAATAYTTTSGCERAGTIKASGAMLAAPRIPNLRGFWVEDVGGGLMGGLKACY